MLFRVAFDLFFKRILGLGIFGFFSTAAQAAWLGYALSQGLAQGSLLLRARPVEEVLKENSLDPRTERYLRISQAVLLYAEKNLKLKTGKNYRSFVRLQNDWVTQVLSAAPPDELTPHLFSFPIVGRVPYKGFFTEAEAQAEARKLRAQGLDVVTRGVDAFSSLGWFADPLLSSMFDSEAQFIETLFHELSHLSFYFKNAADFNEAFATWFGSEIAARFIADRRDLFPDEEKLRAEILRSRDFRSAFAVFMRDILEKGRTVYSEKNEKGAPLQKVRAEYFAWIKERARQSKNLTKLANLEWNNALVTSFGTYYELIPSIEKYAAEHKLDPMAFLTLLIREKKMPTVR